MAVELGMIGKHPSLGDFLCLGTRVEMSKPLTAWLDPALHALRGDLGDDWAAVWDTAQTLRFWWGRALFGRTVAGVFLPSCDSVGRRYPLLLLAAGADLAPPMQDADQSPYERMEEWLAQAADSDAPVARPFAALTADSLRITEEPPDAAQDGPILWAHRRDGALDHLLAEAGPIDAARAQTARTYWWAPGGAGRSAIWLGQPGLPTSASLLWLLGGVPGQRAEPSGQPEVETAQGPDA